MKPKNQILKQTEKSNKEIIQEIKQQVYKEIKATKDMSISRAKKVDALLVKHKTRFSSYINLTNFKEPCAFFERRSGHVEFLENVTAGVYKFKHSDGEERYNIIPPSASQKRFGVGKRSFRGYYLHEDYPLPLPQDPLMTAEQVNIAIDKALTEMKEWKAKELMAKRKYAMVILWLLVILIGGYVLYKMVVPSAPPEPSYIITQAGQNISKVILG